MKRLDEWTAVEVFTGGVDAKTIRFQPRVGLVTEIASHQSHRHSELVDYARHNGADCHIGVAVTTSNLVH